MEKLASEKYESPQVEIIEVEVEKGFATSKVGDGEPAYWDEEIY